MFLAWKELKHSKLKYTLIVCILTLILFLVLFLAGLAQGLSRATTGMIVTSQANSYLLSEDSDKRIDRSEITDENLKIIVDSLGNNATPISIKRTNIEKLGEDIKLDITYVALNPDDFMMPKVKEGNTISKEDGKHEIVLNNLLKDKGIKIGDTIKDAQSNIELKVVGFTENQMYAHSSVGFIYTDTFNEINKKNTGTDKKIINAIAIKDSIDYNLDTKNIVNVSRADIMKNIPGYSQEQSSIWMILVVLLVVSAVILGVFFYVITIQKISQFGVLKAIGAGNDILRSMIIGQVIILAGFSMIIGDALTFLMASFLPRSMPFLLNIPMAIAISVSFIIISILSSLFSLLKIRRVDPLVAIGGGE